MEYKQIPVGQARDLTGQVFGRLTVLYRTENKAKMTRWVCQCECGTIKDYNAQSLINGTSCSCGCLNREKASERMKNYNLEQQSIKIGDKFGKLTVVEYLGLRKQKSRDKNASWYLCNCDCGVKSIEIMGNLLVSGQKKSCGCVGSTGELKIQNILNARNIPYKKEYSFDDLINPVTLRKLRFDFCVFNESEDIQYLIEFDGRQHYLGPEAKWTHSSSLEEIQERDKLKNNYCKEHNIILKRIPYYDYDLITYENLISNKWDIEGE